RLLTQARVQLEEMRIGLVGYEERASETDVSEIEYRNEQVESWAKELETEVTPERLEEITRDMHAAVEREAVMVDDPNSPSRWFGNVILSNDSKKSRNRPDITGRPMASIPSRRYVAENMVDML